MFYPRGALELTSLCATLVLSAVFAILWRRRHTRALLYLAYFTASLALLLSAHVIFGREPFAISTYGVMLVVGAMAAWSLILRRLPQAGVPPAAIYAIILGCLILGIVGGRIADVVGSVMASTETASADGGRLAGLGVFGAFGLDIVYVTVLLRVFFPGVSVLGTLDAGASSVLLNVGIARVGCLLAGCCFGAPSKGFLSLPLHWFDPSSPAARSTPVHATHLWATQPIESVVVLAMAAACDYAWRHRERFGLEGGAVICLAAVSYGSARFTIEFCRGDSVRVCLGLTVWQYCAAALVLVATIVSLRRWRAA